MPRSPMHLGPLVVLLIVACGKSPEEVPVNSPARAASSSAPATAPSNAPESDKKRSGIRPARPSSIRISRTTTYLEGPVTSDGYIDYAAAINERASQGVTPLNNAAVPIWQIVGSSRIPPSHRERFFRGLGIDVVPETGTLTPFRPGGVRPNTGSSFETLVPDSHLRYAFRIWKQGEDPAYAAWLSQHSRALDQIVGAARRPMSYSPMISKRQIEGRDVVLMLLLEDGQLSRDLARVLLARATLRIGEGQFEKAQDDILAAHYLAGHQARRGFMISHLVAVNVDAMACRAGQLLALSDSLPPADAVRFRTAVEKLPEFPDMIGQLDQIDRLMLLDSATLACRHGASVLSQLEEDDPDASSSRGILSSSMEATIDWNIVCEIINETVDRYVETLRIPEREIRNTALDEFHEKMRDWKMFAGADGAIDVTSSHSIRQEMSELAGRIFVGLTLPNGALLQKARERVPVRRNLTSLSYALGAFRRSHGSYPDSLNRLVPDSIPALPKDPYTRSDYVYRRERDGFLVYSVGPNGLDDDGITDEESEEADDIRVATPGAEPKTDEEPDASRE